MTQQTVVVDYGVGNLLSVARALQTAGGRIELSGDANKIAAADRLVQVPLDFGAIADALEETDLSRDDHLIEIDALTREYTDAAFDEKKPEAARLHYCTIEFGGRFIRETGITRINP